MGTADDDREYGSANRWIRVPEGLVYSFPLTIARSEHPNVHRYDPGASSL